MPRLPLVASNGCRRDSGTPHRTKIIDPLIIVAVANMGEDRVHEYTPTPGVIKQKADGRNAAAVCRDFWPFSGGRTQTFHRSEISNSARPNIFTGLGGSSLGGLVTLAIGILYRKIRPADGDVAVRVVG